MLKNLKKFVMCLLMIIAVFVTNFSAVIPVYASENESEFVDENSRNIPILRAGTETLKYGQNLIGSFTFTDTNLSPVKTIPSGASSFQLRLKFRKAASDKGIGDVKLTVQIRRTNGTVVYSGSARDVSGLSGQTEFLTEVVGVSSGQQYQIWLDASSVNPSQSNGNFRSIEVDMYSIVW